MLRKAVVFDTARSGPQSLPLIFDRPRWEQVKRKYVYGHSSSSSSLNKNENDHEDNYEGDAPYRAYEEYKQQQKEVKQKSNNKAKKLKNTLS